MLQICNGEDLWKWPWLDIRLNVFPRSTIPQKQFINISLKASEFIAALTIVNNILMSLDFVTQKGRQLTHFLQLSFISLCYSASMLWLLMSDIVPVSFSNLPKLFYVEM